METNIRVSTNHSYNTSIYFTHKGPTNHSSIRLNSGQFFEIKDAIPQQLVGFRVVAQVKSQLYS